MKTEQSLIASVAVESTVYHFDKAFDYAVPVTLSENLRPGCRVKVPFARGNRHRQGMVMSLKSGDAQGLKFISEQLDSEPVLTKSMLALAEFMKRNYYCTPVSYTHLTLPTKA